MNTLEDRLRAAYRSVADTVDPATVHAPPARAKPRAARFRTPLAAAAVVAVVAAVAALPAYLPKSHHAPAHRVAATGHRGGTAFPGLPAFTLVNLGSSLTVFGTRTGAVVATVKPPKGLTFEVVASGGTAGSYLAAAAPANAGCHAYFYRFTLSGSGQPSSLTRLRSVPGSDPSAITAVLGGYAYSTVHCYTAPPNGGVGIGSSFWEYPQGDDYATSLSATADGRTLALTLETNSGYDLLLLNTRSGSSTVLGASRVRPFPLQTSTVAISPDGQTVYACGATGADASDTTLAAYSASTGKLIRVLHQWQTYTAQQFYCQLSADPTGRYLLAATSPELHEPFSITGFDLRTGASAALRISQLPPGYYGAQFAW